MRPGRHAASGLFCGLAMLSAAAGAAAESRELQAGPWSLHCTQKALLLYCDYRAIGPGAPARPAAGARLPETGIPLQLLEESAFPGPGERAAALFLVDTSDPRRGPVVAANVRQIRGLIEATGAHWDFGLAGFDKGMKLLAPLGRERQELAAATDALQAEGLVTELYRSAIEAISELERVDAGRKALVILSDGLAEDVAYTLQDVVQAARAARVTIIGLGYARSEAQTVGLQTLRRLARETGGYFIEADRTFRLPEAFLEAPFDRLDRGGRFLLDLEQAIDEGAAGDSLVEILLEPAQFEVPVNLPRPAPPMPPSDAFLPPDTGPRPPERELPPAPAGRFVPGWPAALAALLLVLILLRYREGLRRAVPSPAETAVKPLAWLENRLDEEAEGTPRVHPLTGSPWRIGRASNNDLVLSGETVSRHHAEILYSGAGRFRIVDLGAANGIFINGKRVAEAQLSPGDRIDMGEHTLYFSLNDPNLGSPQDQTVLIPTQLPEPGKR